VTIGVIPGTSNDAASGTGRAGSRGAGSRIALRAETATWRTIARAHNAEPAAATATPPTKPRNSRRSAART
jgi:hypothetical protein